AQWSLSGCYRLDKAVARVLADRSAPQPLEVLGASGAPVQPAYLDRDLVCDLVLQRGRRLPDRSEVPDAGFARLGSGSADLDVRRRAVRSPQGGGREVGP